MPADYARHVATQEGSTWYRMLTDDVGNFRELSTTSYQPTEPIWRTVTVRDHTCVWPGCTRPAVLVHCDHRIPHPRGTTCPANLQPLCERHHQVKHADGYHVERNPDGSYTWTSRHGSTFTTPASEQPVDPYPHDTGTTYQERVDALFTAITSPLEKTFIDLLLVNPR